MNTSTPPCDINHRLLAELWNYDQVLRAEGKDGLYALGLDLVIPPDNVGLFPSPRNSLRFARTGGNGVHFSLICVDNVISDKSPVIVTVPFSSDGNVVVGKDLREFLCLGCRVGFGSMEGLADDFDSRTRKEYQNSEVPDALDWKASWFVLLEEFAQHFRLRPWQDVTARLSDLQEEFLPLLELPEVSPRPPRTKKSPFDKFLAKVLKEASNLKSPNERPSDEFRKSTLRCLLVMACVPAVQAVFERYRSMVEDKHNGQGIDVREMSELRNYLHELLMNHHLIEISHGDMMMLTEAVERSLRAGQDYWRG